MAAKSYREVESKRGGKSFHPSRLAFFRDEPCNLRRHFEMGSTLREVISLAELLAKNDSERFIYINDWSKKIKRSKRSIEQSLCIAESAKLLTPTIRSRPNKNGFEKPRKGWIVADHDLIREVKDGQCNLNIELRMNAPLRKKGEHRWQNLVEPLQQSAFPNPGSIQEESGSSEEVSAFQSAFDQSPSASVSASESAFQSAFNSELECISDTSNKLPNNNLGDTTPRKSLSNPLNPLNPENLENENPQNSVENQPLSRFFSKPKSTPSGKEISQEVTAFVCDLFRYADNFVALFDLKQQFAVADLLDKYPADDIRELWQQVWDSKDEARKKFAVRDFLKTADQRLEQKAVWGEHIADAKIEKEMPA